MENLLISSCFLGNNVKYNGSNNKLDYIDKLKEKYNLIPICPEVLAGLEIPRDPSEIRNDKVISSKGYDVTNNFNLGALLALDIAIKNNCKKALLKESSPSCGVNTIYDGTFRKNKINGLGITSRLLKENGILLYSENDIEKLF